MDTADCSNGKSDSSLLPLASSNIRADTEYEWSGVFETPANIYLWSAQKVEGQYADTSMKLVALHAPNSTPQALQDLSEKAQVVELSSSC
jgi:hypothetical protein